MNTNNEADYVLWFLKELSSSNNDAKIAFSMMKKMFPEEAKRYE